MTKHNLNKIIQHKLAGIPTTTFDEDFQQYVLDYKIPKICLHEDLAKMSVDDLVKKINEVGSNKKSIMFLIGNGINRMKNSKNNNGVMLLTAALALLSGAGDDASLINLAKRIAYTGLTGR